MRLEYAASSDGPRISFERSGSGPPLVLVHGTSVERFSFRFVSPLLTDRFSLCALDRRARGGSGDSTDGYSIEQEFLDLAAVVDSLDEPADVFGHSYGATVAIGAVPLARNLRRLILYQPAPGLFGRSRAHRPAREVGSESPGWAKQGTEIARSLLRNSRVAELAGEGHLAILTAPELVAEEITRFLGD